MQPLVTPPVPPPSTLESVLSSLKPVIPIPVLLVVLAGLWWFFRDTWKELDDDATYWRAQAAGSGKTDLRPLVALVTCAFVLTLQEYYGVRSYFDQAIRPLLARLDVAHPTRIKLYKYDELYGFGWWVFTRFTGYVAPFAVWKVAFPGDSLLDMGLRVRGFFSHAWIYGLFVVVLVPILVFVSREPDFGAYYPFYKMASRSWLDLLAWEAMYFLQFFGLEMFFRGFWLGALRRSFGSGAIFSMAVPYCMIHFGKPFFEVPGAILAGIALGSLSMKTKSIYQGFLVHITIAGLMDWLTLWRHHALPTVFRAPG
ncbi:MAG TPA: CPBP family intramembrane glutamic endopeptidase [Polyangiaceae bacterium]|nr:CPBP family intramembrane glutamic endopeptidase [Polyangiaceae bacterium]